jgi:cathepsin A (carboxypeptidase C)
MQHFFSESHFPELAANEFFITGESYAGVYVPTLAKEILDNAPEINLKGVAVGDPCTDNKAQKDSMDMLWYGHKNGFVDPAVFDLLWNHCGARHAGHGMAPLGASAPGGNDLPRMTMQSTSSECIVAQRKYLASTSKGFSQTWKNDYINNLSLFSPSAVVDFSAPGSLNYETAAWMMRADVRAALHVETSPNAQWPGPGPRWMYTKQYDACNPSPVFKKSMVDFYRDIAPRLRTTIVFNGDTDPCVSYEGTRAAIATVFPEAVGGAWRPWFFNSTAAPPSFLAEKPLLFGPSLSPIGAGAQLGGLVQDYEHGLSFATVHGSGHMVPQFRPRAALRLLSRLLTGDRLAAPLPSDVELAAMTPDAFDAFLDKWTIAEKAAV